MGRKKVRLELIGKESTRKTTFRKRKAGMLKKAFELTTLCGIKGCAIIYGPNEQEPHVWPSKEEAARVLKRFRALSPIKRAKHMKNHDQCIEKSPRMKNRETELEVLLGQVDGEEEEEEELFKMMSLEDMKDLSNFLDKRVGENPSSSDRLIADRRQPFDDEEEEYRRRRGKRYKPACSQ
ncbi:hypothetical protein SAY86_013013 [Trapa natans]|uniref:MADS-box domain-containing protein n=1 Tax=Trapa natans TaxID=22666 RepID=A0AAN7R7Q4_TRANT|nr:hypothetical protein SAY86_013013 [Trapa natans]